MSKRQGQQQRAPLQPPTAPSRDRPTRTTRPTEKVQAEYDMAAEKMRAAAEKEARRAEREKKKQRQAEAEAGIDTREDNELEEREEPVFTSRIVPSKPALLAKRSGRVPQAPSQLFERSPTPEVDEDVSDRGRTMHRVHTRRRTLPSSDLSRSPSQARPSSPPAVPVPATFTNRKRSLDDDSDEEEVQEIEREITSKAQKIDENCGRPKAADYDDETKEVILAAASRYRCLISTVNGFPDSAAELAMTRDAWQYANDNSGLQAIAITPRIAKIIKARGSQMRGDIKKKVVSLVEALYGFESGQSSKIIKSNRATAEDLKDEKGFVYRERDVDKSSRKGVYQHPIIQKLVNTTWFANKKGDGVVNGDVFSPLPVRAIALILTAIECGIDEWVTGTKTEVPFFSDEYRSTYLDHIKSLEKFGRVTSKNDLLGRLQRRLYNYARHHAGVPPAAIQQVDAIPVAAFEAANEEYEQDSATDSEGEMMMP